MNTPIPKAKQELGNSEHLSINKEALSDNQEIIPSVELIKPLGVNQDGWTLIWEDTFDSSTLNESNWTMENWAAGKNGELEYYSPNNVQTVNGKLVLTSKKERYQGRDYPSGAVQTKNKLEFHYGKLEMRAKLPVGQGSFPAFWLLTNKEDTWLPEIDILEMLGHKPNEIWMVHHWLGDNNKLTSESSSFEDDDFSKDFHIYGVEWTEDYIAWFIDGVERFQSATNIPKDDMYLYINTAIRGVWPGNPDYTTEIHKILHPKSYIFRYSVGLIPFQCLICYKLFSFFPFRILTVLNKILYNLGR